MPTIFGAHAGAVFALGLALLSGCQSTLARKSAGANDAAQTEKEIHLNDSQVADVQVALGRGFENRAENQQAMATYAQAIEKDPKRSEPYVRLAILQDQQGKFSESAKLYEKAFQLQPADADICNNQGYSLYLQQRWSEAERYLRQSLQLQPDHRVAHNNLGLVLARQGRNDEALQEFARAGVTRAEAHSNLAYEMTLANCWDTALTHYEQALAVDADCATAKKGLRQLKTVIAKMARSDTATQTIAGAQPELPSIVKAPAPVLPACAQSPQVEAAPLRGEPILADAPRSMTPVSAPLGVETLQSTGGPVLAEAPRPVTPIAAPTSDNDANFKTPPLVGGPTLSNAANPIIPATARTISVEESPLPGRPTVVESPSQMAPASTEATTVKAPVEVKSIAETPPITEAPVTTLSPE